MVKIAVVGATGPTGIHLVTELRKTVAAVRVIARSMDKLVRLFPALLTTWFTSFNSVATPGGSKTICRRQTRGTPHDDGCADGVAFGLVFGGRHNGDTDRNPTVS
jgi:hypothetical protein